MAKILVVSANLRDWNIDSGGKERTYHLMTALKDHDVTFLSFSWDGDGFQKNISSNIYQIQPAVPASVTNRYRKLVKGIAAVNYDACFSLLQDDLLFYTKKIKELSKLNDLLIVDHMSISPLIPDSLDIPIIYNSHNSEISMAKQLYPEDSKIIQIVKQTEKSIIKKSIGVTYCSKQDIIDLENYYGSIKNSMYIPNGTQAHDYVDPKHRLKSRDIIFIGSGHPPNIEAAKKLIQLAKLMPEYNFIVIGHAGNGLNGQQYSNNLKVVGRVDDKQLNNYFSNSFAFINPMDAGSGTHLKMMRALSYGIPIITSAVGARGFSNEEISSSMVIADSITDMCNAIKKIQDKKIYINLSKNAYEHSKKYEWKTIQKDYLNFINNFINVKQIAKNNDKPIVKEKILVYSIIRNRDKYIPRFRSQLKKMVMSNQEYEFYLSIYENDSTDLTKSELFKQDWSFFKGVSIISENINTEYFESVKDAQRVENLAKARNRAIEAAGFLDKVDYVLMVEGDVIYSNEDIKKLLTFKEMEPNFDIVSSISLRKNGKHYDWWATRTSAIYNKDKSEIEEDYENKKYGKYYSTSNGLCLYRSKPFKEGIRHHWINTETKEFDCEMVVLCQEFHKRKYSNIYIYYESKAHHI